MYVKRHGTSIPVSYTHLDVYKRQPQSYGGDFSGSAFVKGYDTTKVPVGRLAFVSGMLFQDPAGQLICPTVEDEVAFGPENRGLPVDKVNSLIDECLDYVRMSGYRDKSPHALSGGQQQAVAIASVLAMEPDIYVLDEPTSNLEMCIRDSIIAL